MDNISIHTTQNVDIEYQLASIGDRILATLLDYLFFLAYFLLIVLLAALTKWELFDSMAIVSILALPILFYDLICEVLFQGKSFGKMIMKIKVVMMDGTQANFGAYLLRWLLRIIDMRLFGGALALIAILINGKGQRIGDMAAGTTVIKMKQKVQLSDTIFNKLKPDYSLVFPEVSRLTDNDVAIIKEVMQVCVQSNNFEAIDKLVLKTKATMGVTSHLPHAQFLSAVIQDYNYLGNN
jgi:uncharacterized RDD family membrane protein YckC